MKNIKAKAFFCAAILGLTTTASAATVQLFNLKLQSIRAVGKYQDPLFSDTLELWFTTPLTYPTGSSCSDTRRVYIDSKNYHLVAAAYLALSKGKTLSISLDEALPVRMGACEITYMDIMAQ